VRTASAAVGGQTETILVNNRGLPLYYYRPDTATRSLVTGGLAQLWPPLTSAAPAAAGVSGKLAVLNFWLRRHQRARRSAGAARAVPAPG
jgi:predicted lipoprotein with Yx(FWY)xxD motif